MVGLLIGLMETQMADYVKIGRYDVTYNPNMNNGEWEIFDHDSDHTRYTEFSDVDDAVEYITIGNTAQQD